MTDQPRSVPDGPPSGQEADGLPVEFSFPAHAEEPAPFGAAPEPTVPPIRDDASDAGASDGAASDGSDDGGSDDRSSDDGDSDDGDSDDGGVAVEAGQKRRRRGSRGGRRRRKAKEQPDGGAAPEPTGDASADADADSDGEDEGDAPEAPASDGPKRRRSRGRRSRKRTEDAPTDERADDRADEASDDTDPDDDSAEDDGAPRKRRRGRRGGKRRKRKAGSSADADGADDDDDGDDDAVGIEAIPGEDDDLEELGPPPAKKAGKKKSRKRGKRAAAADDDAPPARAEVDRDQVILVNAAGVRETRVAVVEKGRIVDLQMSVQGQDTYVNDIYRGRVVNLEPAIGAAFVDFGEGRNGFLHVSDVMEIYGEPNWTLDKILNARTDVEEWESKGPKAEEFESDEPDQAEGKGKGKQAKGARVKRGRSRGRKRYAVGELLQKGQLVVCQITKDAIGDKGPTLTTYVSIPGRYLVLMPSLERTGVSRKIEDEKERRRLKRILQSLSIPEGMGVIVRTAGIGKTKTEIKRDLEYLLAVWETFSQRLVLGRAPAPLYQESDVAVRTMRDLFSSRTEKVVVDDPDVFEHMREFTRSLMPEHEDRILLDESGRPVFHAEGVEQDFEKIFSKRVELPSGGSIVIDQTEALVAIDVNSGRTRDDTTDFENIALKTNLEAAPEIARQIRLRDLGGILVLDFIDMMRMANRRTVEKAFRDALASDRARSKVGRISQFGLLELTRQRLGPGLDKLVYDTCTYCRGSGRRRTARSKADAVLRRMGSALQQKGFTRIEVFVHPDTLDYLKRHAQDRIDVLAERTKREIEFKTAPEQLEDSIFHYLRADGREVRPGGRRKR